MANTKQETIETVIGALAAAVVGVLVIIPFGSLHSNLPSVILTASGTVTGAVTGHLYKIILGRLSSKQIVPGRNYHSGKIVLILTINLTLAYAIGNLLLSGVVSAVDELEKSGKISFSDEGYVRFQLAAGQYLILQMICLVLFEAFLLGRRQPIKIRLCLLSTAVSVMLVSIFNWICGTSNPRLAFDTLHVVQAGSWRYYIVFALACVISFATITSCTAAVIWIAGLIGWKFMRLNQSSPRLTQT